MLKSIAELESGFDALSARGIDGVIVQPSFGVDRPAALAIKHRLPSVSFRRNFAEAGGLMAYGADQAELSRTLASSVDRVLKGTPIAELPVQQATRFELIVNQRTAKAIGLVIPPLFLASADEVIE